MPGVDVKMTNGLQLATIMNSYSKEAEDSRWVMLGGRQLSEKLTGKLHIKHPRGKKDTAISGMFKNLNAACLSKIVGTVTEPLTRVAPGAGKIWVLTEVETTNCSTTYRIDIALSPGSLRFSYAITLYLKSA